MREINMFELIFGITLLLFSITSVLSIFSLHSDNEKRFNITKILYFISILLFLSSGIIKFNLTSASEFIRATHTIWGYFYLISSIMMLTVLYLYFTRWKNQLKSILAIAAPFITIIIIISIPFIDSERRFALDLEHSLLPIHILITTIGELFFFFSFIGSILYLVMEWQLRKKTSMKFIYRLPNLETIDNFNRWAISRSFALLTLGLIVGIVLLWVNFSALFLASPKEIIIYSSWFFILGLLYLRYKKNVNSHKVSQINTILFIIIMGMYLITNIFIRSGFHSYK
jgi:ABC-type transport system involved in cytochrome c biogenesis permease subunit